MGKSFLIIFGVYFLYYMGNILYDLFLKKEKIIETENNEQNFSLSELADLHQESPIYVEIEDVENIRTPQSFENESYDFLSANEEPQIMENLQKKYEDENQLEKIEHIETSQEKEVEKTTSIIDQPIKSLSIKDLLNDANTKIKMVANYDGQKVYHIQS